MNILSSNKQRDVCGLVSSYHLTDHKPFNQLSVKGSKSKSLGYYILNY